METYLEAWLIFGMILLALLAACFVGFLGVICFIKIENDAEEGRE